MLNNAIDGHNAANLQRRQLYDERRLAEKNSFINRMDEENRRLAKKVHETTFTYALYGFLDGLSTSYSMVKYIFDSIYTNSTISPNDSMHDWMLTPQGIAIAATESVFIIATSMIASACKKSNLEFIKFIVTYQPYLRDGMKGLKNAFKGMRSVLQAAALLSEIDLRYLMVPIGVVLGILSVANRIWNRNMITQRKDWQDANCDLLKLILDNDPQFAENNLNDELAAFERQLRAPSNRNAAYLSAAYGGFIDGLYLFMGCLTLTSFFPPILITVLVFSSIFALLNIGSRMYEEKVFQDKLVATQNRVKLALCGKKLEGLVTQLQSLSVQLAQADNDPETRTRLTAQQRELNSMFDNKCIEFDRIHSNLKSQVTLSYKTAVLTGLGNGLYAYNAITSVLFGIATMCAIFSTPVSPMLVLGCAIAGMVCLLGFIGYACWQHYLHQKNPTPEVREANDLLIEFEEDVKRHRNTLNQLNLSNQYVKDTIRGGMCVDSSPQFFFQEWFEVIRSFFSGLAKGQKSVDYALNPLQEVDVKGHVHDTPVMTWITIGISALYSFGLALRAYAKGFGKIPENADALPPPPPLSEPEPTKASPIRAISSPAPLKLSTSEGYLLAPQLSSHAENRHTLFATFGDIHTESSDVDESNIYLPPPPQPQAMMAQG